ncbi:MAG: methyltransferase domain-containing protein [Candidatus Micrarchaeia archaeon]
MIREGATRLDGEGVFYNPAMAFNRSVSSLAVKALAPERVLDGFCASGARGLRYALEGCAGKITFLDYSPVALKRAKANARLNKVKAEFVRDDFNHYCYSGEKFDFVEVDPFGSPTPFLSSAINALHKRGFLSVTATDLANSCASMRERAVVCVRQYQAAPVKCDCSHELALRIIAGKACREAAARDYSFTPMVSWYERHYAKTIALLEKTSAGADASLAKLGFVSLDSKSLDRCEGAHPNWRVAGPLWTGELCDATTLKKMTASAPEKEARFLNLLSGELDLPPFHWDLHMLSSSFGLQVSKISIFLDVLRSRGFRAVRAHYSGNAFKTDARLADIKRAIKKAGTQ